MATIKINIGAVLGSGGTIVDARAKISGAKSSLESTWRQVDSRILGRNNIANRFQNISSKIGSIEDRVSRIRSVVDRSADRYHDTEQTILNWSHDVAASVGAAGGSGGSDGGSDALALFESVGRVKVEKNPLKHTDPPGTFQDTLLKIISKRKPVVVAGLLNTVSPATGLLYITSGVSQGKVPAFFDSSRTAGATSGADWLGYEVSDDNPGITAWTGKAYAQTQNEWGYAGINAYVGKAEAEADADFSFMETTKKKEYVDGKWVEKTVTEFAKAEVGASVSVSVLEVDGEAGIGSDMLGIDVGAEGSAGNAKAEAKAKFSIADDGVNANLSGEAMVSAVEGEAKGTINILGIEITGKIGGYAGAVGVEGKIGVEGNKFVMEGGLAALLGVSGGVEIGFNDEGWDNFVEYVAFWK